MSMEDVVFLHPVEVAALDAVTCQRFMFMAGSANGDHLADDLVEDFVLCLSAIESAWISGEFTRLFAKTGDLERLAETLGMPSVVSVARHLAGCEGGRDDVAIAALVARAVRLGEASLASILEIAYQQG